MSHWLFLLKLSSACEHNDNTVGVISCCDMRVLTSIIKLNREGIFCANFGKVGVCCRTRYTINARVMSEPLHSSSGNSSSNGEGSSSRRDHDRSRKDAHRREVLNRKRQEKLAEELQKKWKRDKEFLSILQFRNDLPDPPAGPFCVKMALPNPLEKYADYFKSSLEQKYTWKMHWENDLGLNLSFVDPKQWQGPVKPPKMEPADEQLVHWESNNGKAKVRAGKTPDMPKASWLKRTMYMTNDLFDSVHKFKSDSISQQILNQEEQRAQAARGPFEVEAIEMSFAATAAKRPVPERDDMKVEWVIPIMPDEALWANHYSVVNFRADPALTDGEMGKKRPRNATGIEGDDATTEADRRRSKVLKSIVTNDRLGDDGGYLISLIAPSDEDTVATQEGEYSWIRDYSLERRDPRDTFYVFMIDPEPAPEAAGQYSQLEEEMCCAVNRAERQCTYVPLNSNMRLERLATVKSEPHSATVRRRFMDPWERKERAATLAEVWPVVLPDLFDELPEVRPSDIEAPEEPTPAAVTVSHEFIDQEEGSQDEDEEQAIEDAPKAASRTTAYDGEFLRVLWSAC